MNLQQAKSALELYERRLEQKAILEAVIAEGRLDWAITSSVTVNGAKKDFSLSVSVNAVNTLLNNRLATVTADAETLRISLGLDP